ELAKATGSKKGAVTKHINRVVDGLLDPKAELSEEDAALGTAGGVKNLEKARERGNGRRRETLETAPPEANADAIRDVASDLCLRTDGKIAKEEYDAIVQWLMKGGGEDTD